MACATMKLHLALAGVLCLALVVAEGRPAAYQYQPPAYQCSELQRVDACADEIIKHYERNGKVFSPECCNQLARQLGLGCGCLVRDKVLQVTRIVDLQEPFCVDGSGCPSN